MSNSTPNIFCSFSSLLEVAGPPAASHGSFVDMPTSMYGTTYTDVPVLYRPDPFSIRVNYYNGSGVDFPTGSIVFCQSTLTSLECGSVDPLLTVRATSLIG